jgi:hypothetical protein
MLQSNIVNMRKESSVGYHLSFQMFNVFSKDIHGNIHDVIIKKLESWSSNWILANEKFKVFLT